MFDKTINQSKYQHLHQHWGNTIVHNNEKIPEELKSLAVNKTSVNATKQNTIINNELKSVEEDWLQTQETMKTTKASTKQKWEEEQLHGNFKRQQTTYHTRKLGSGYKSESLREKLNLF